MNSIERFYATIERRPVDRPVCWVPSPLPDAVPALCDFYKVKDLDELRLVWGDDFYTVEVPYRSPQSEALYAAFDWLMDGEYIDPTHRTLTAVGCFADCEDIEDIEAINFPWPDPADYIDPEECRRLVEKAPADKVVFCNAWACHFQDCCSAFGMQNALMNLVAAPELVHYLDDRIVDFYLKALQIFLEATKGKLHAMLIGDDVGTQRGLLISPEQIKEFVIPGAKKMIDLIHSYGVKVIYHSCGSIFQAIPLLIEAGVDAINPIQAMAANMEPQKLKDAYGAQMSFCGGVDTQVLMVYGSPEEIKEKVRELRKIFPTGLIVAPSHDALQSDVPPANLKALIDEACVIYED